MEVSPKKTMTAFKLLRIILEELDAFLQRRGFVDDKKLLIQSTNFGGFEGVGPGSQRENDLNALKRSAVKIRAKGTIIPAAKSLMLETKDWKWLNPPISMCNALQNLHGGYRTPDAVSSDSEKLKRFLGMREAEEDDYDEIESFVKLSLIEKLGLSKSVRGFLAAEGEEDQLDEEGLVTAIRGFSRQLLSRGRLFYATVRDNIELVHFDDLYSQMKCVYAVTVNHTKKKVTVVFRGSVTSNDWRNNIDIAQRDAENPAGDPKTIGIHKGFYEFLCRPRLDQRSGGPSTRCECIINDVYDILKGKNKDWRLCVTGHSLGGALATLFGFYAAADNRIGDRGQPVEIFTFASPLVGDKNFRKAFKTLEHKRKIIHARFCNTGDLVTMIPAVATREGQNFPSPARYQHVGLQIQLRSTSSTKPARVFYNSDKTRLQAMKTTFDNLANWATFVPKMFGAGGAHKMVEYEKRLVYEIEKENNTVRTGLTSCDLEQYYKKHILQNKTMGHQRQH